MNILYKGLCRIYQAIMRLGSMLLPWREPQLICGAGAIIKLPSLIREKNITRVMLLTDSVLCSLGLLGELEKGLHDEAIDYVIYRDVQPNPTIENIEDARTVYLAHQCQALIAFGGGSVMDCAKAVGARIVCPNKSLIKMRGLFRVLKRLPPLFAVPTTAGTGSEATLAAVITDAHTHHKYTINDLSLIPRFAVLDPLLTVKLPPAITAATGLDALTHAVEAYIGASNTALTRKMACEAVKLIFENLETAYYDGSSVVARECMLIASYKAGVAFTRAYVGNVHALAHALGGRYGIPHGIANASLLPHVLRFYGSCVYRRLAQLADLAEIGNGKTEAEKAILFIEAIEHFNRTMGIPEFFPELRLEDIPQMISFALAEVNPLYPVPIILNRQTATDLLSSVLTQSIDV